MAQSEQPLERFKRSTGATIRAIAERDDITANFTPTSLGLVGNEARLPLPSRDLPVDEVAQVRGEADSIALKLRHHDTALHVRQRPANPAAREIYDAFERVRCEALGMRRMAGVGQNLDAVLEERCRSRGYSRATTREEAPLSEVLSLLAREAMTGQPPPPSARSMVDLWRPALDSEVFKDLDELARLAGDQDAFAHEIHRLLEHLDMDATVESEPLSDEDMDSQGEDAESDPSEAEGEGGEGDAAEGTSSAEGELVEGSESEDGDDQAAEVDGEMMQGSGDEEPGRPGRPPAFDAKPQHPSIPFRKITEPG